jgi:hypothetical protein
MDEITQLFTPAQILIALKWGGLLAATGLFLRAAWVTPGPVGKLVAKRWPRAFAVADAVIGIYLAVTVDLVLAWVRARARTGAPLPSDSLTPPAGRPAPTRAGDERPTPPAPRPPGEAGFATLHALLALVAACVLAVVLGMLAGGCTPRPWQDTAHIAINAAAHGVAASDTLVAGAITRDARDTARSADQLEAHYRPAITALGALRASLVAAQGAVDTAVATQAAPDRCRALELIGRARALAEDLATALRAAGVTVPDEVPRAVRLAGELAASLSPRCEVSDGG